MRVLFARADPYAQKSLRMMHEDEEDGCSHTGNRRRERDISFCVIDDPIKFPLVHQL